MKRVLVFSLGFLLVAAGCGGNLDAEKDKAYEKQMRKETADLAEDLEEWAKEVEQSLKEKEQAWARLTPAQRKAKQDSVVRYVNHRIDQAAAKINKVAAMSGPEAKAKAQAYADELKELKKNYRGDFDKLSAKLEEDMDDFANTFDQFISNAWEKVKNAAKTDDKK